MTLPDQLTLARALAVPVVVVLFAWDFSGHLYWATAVFAVAMATDQIDGWLARRWHVESDFGKVVDPLADRLMIDAAIILLWAAGRLPFVALALILIRDGVLLGGYRFFQGKGIDLNVSLLGKIATWILYASLCLTIVTPGGTDWPLWLFWIGLILALVAGARYVVSTLNAVRGRPA